MALSVAAQLSEDDCLPPVLDTAGRDLERGIEYYIKPAVNDNGGRFTFDRPKWLLPAIHRSGKCFGSEWLT